MTSMNYQETVQYLYDSAPLFQQVGKAAYKEGLENTYALDAHLGHPHRQFKTIHVAGTNGKGSCSHTLAAILQAAGYRTGLYTSPHLVDFRERIRINGECIEETYVIDFVEQHRTFFEPLHPSFFELTTAMAFRYFADREVDIAVIEVGLGGRLDCTNIITPLVALITNISFDHVQFLGDTLEKIATEKAGIIKPGIPVIVNETTPETRKVFTEKADNRSPLLFAEDEAWMSNVTKDDEGRFVYDTFVAGRLTGELRGNYQLLNSRLVLAAVKTLRQTEGLTISDEAVKEGFAHVCALTGLRGRWEKLGEYPLMICDTGHNTGGMTYIVEQLSQQTYEHLHIVIGMVNDKDIDGVLAMLPKQATYYFTQASVSRALPAAQLAQKAATHGLTGTEYTSVEAAVGAAKAKATTNDMIFIGGSSFIVADLLSFYDK